MDFSSSNKFSSIVFLSLGYRVSFNPTAPGEYLITIKFAGINIAGSPFKCIVGGNDSFNEGMKDGFAFVFVLQELV